MSLDLVQSILEWIAVFIIGLIAIGLASLVVGVVIFVTVVWLFLKIRERINDGF